LGSLPIVRFLTVGVGCTCGQCWKDALGASANPESGGVAASANPEGGGVAASADPEGGGVAASADPEGGGVAELYSLLPPSCSSLRDWDVSVTARLDLPDRYGNNAGHMAIFHHATPELFESLESLYSKGFGRYENRQGGGNGGGGGGGAATVTHCKLTVHGIPTHFPALKKGARERVKIEASHLIEGFLELITASTGIAGSSAAIQETREFLVREVPTLLSRSIGACSHCQGKGACKCMCVTLPVPSGGEGGAAAAPTYLLDVFSDAILAGRKLEVRRDASATLFLPLKLTLDTGNAASPRHFSRQHSPSSPFSPALEWATLKRAAQRESSSRPAFFEKTFTWVNSATSTSGSSTPHNSSPNHSPSSSSGGASSSSSSSGSGSGSGTGTSAAASAAPPPPPIPPPLSSEGSGGAFWTA
jgi:hypothetical protein